MALECLQRAFEVGLNYAVFYKKAPQKLLQLHYDAELLITGEPSKNPYQKNIWKQKNRQQKQAPSLKRKQPKTNLKKTNRKYLL